MLSGSGFGKGSTVYIGHIETAVQVTEAKQAEFIVPPGLEAGLYA